MRNLSIFFALVFIVAACQETADKAVQPEPSKHTAAFNNSVDALLNDYKMLSEAFVAWDSTGIISAATRLEGSVNNLEKGIGKDTSVSKAVGDSLVKLRGPIGGILSANDINVQRRHFDTLSNGLFAALTVAAYSAKALYLQKCPMAFNDIETAYWITDMGKDSIRNPYLGKRHPKYGSGMLECGENAKTLSR